ncbi:MAG: PilN domain-containing protein [Deltaproteobacteria bacterium]|nr:PilN domain-containing protein [Deltaproteobacteria bacterium]
MIRINLLETDRKRLEFSYLKTFLPFFYIACMLALMFLALLPAQRSIDEKLKEIKKLDDIKDKASIYPVETNMKVYAERDKKTREQLTFLASLKAKQNNALIILKAVHNNIPASMWVESIEYNKGTATLKGFSFESQAVFDFNNKLKSQSNLKNSDVLFINESSEKISRRSVVEYGIKVENKDLM